MSTDIALDERFGVRGRPRAVASQRWCPWCDGWGRVRDGSMTGTTTDCYHCRGTGEDQEYAKQTDQIAAVLAIHSRAGQACRHDDWDYPCPTARTLGVTA